MGTFSVAVNGPVTNINDLNQFVDAFNGTVVAPLALVGNSTFNPPLVTSVSGSATLFVQTFIPGDTNGRNVLAYDQPNTGYGKMEVSAGGNNGSWMQASSSGWQVQSNLTVAGALTASGALSAGTLQVNGTATNSGAITAGSGSNTCTSIQSGGVWKTADGDNLQVSDDSVNGDLNVVSVGPDNRHILVRGRTSSGVDNNSFRVEQNGDLRGYGLVNFNKQGGGFNGFSGFTATVSGGTYSTGLSSIDNGSSGGIATFGGTGTGTGVAVWNFQSNGTAQVNGSMPAHIILFRKS